MPQITNKGAITMDQSHFNTIEETRKSGRHLSLEERGMIQALHRKGYSLRSIAAEVNCAHTPPEVGTEKQAHQRAQY